MTTPTCGMMKKVEQYLTHRRSLGYRINSDGYQLRSFARYADLHAPGEAADLSNWLCVGPLRQRGRNASTTQSGWML